MNKELKEYIKKIPKQEYVIGDDMICPLCVGELGEELYISNPPQRRCKRCGRLIVVY